jgi:dTMP kinase
MLPFPPNKEMAMTPTQIPGGLLVVIEGIDGAGKTTLASSLRDQLATMGWDVAMSKEPTQGPFGQALRATAVTGRLDADSELSLLLSDRRQHVEEFIRPSLERGAIVILDRYYFSNVAYQGAAGLDVADLLARNEVFAPMPALVLLLDLPVSMGLARIEARGDFANKFEVPATLEAARRIFLETLPPVGVKIDATLGIEEVFNLALGRVILAIAQRVVSTDGLSQAGINRMLVALGSQPIPV